MSRAHNFLPISAHVLFALGLADWQMLATATVIELRILNLHVTRQ